MYKRNIVLLITMLFMTACGGEDSSSSNSNKSTADTNTTSLGVTNNEDFAYQTQRSVNLNISLDLMNASLKKQVLFYETQRVDATPVGELLIYDNLLLEGVTDSSGKYFTEVTLGNHIEDIWVIIPALSYEKNISILNNEIVINITQGL